MDCMSIKNGPELNRAIFIFISASGDAGILSGFRFYRNALGRIERARPNHDASGLVRNVFSLVGTHSA